MFNLYSLTAQSGDIIGGINETIDNAKDELSAVEKFIESYWFSALKAIFFLIIGYVAARILSAMLKKALMRCSVDISLTKFLCSAVRVFIYIIAIISALGILGIPTTGLIAGMSAVAVAISLALKDSLSSLSAGIFLLITRPFMTGEVIKVGDYLGTVKEIKLIHTILKTFDGNEVIVPNSSIIGSTVVNYSREELRRIDHVFSISYDNDPELAKSVMLRTVLRNERILTKPQAPEDPFAKVSAYAASSVDITLRVWCRSGDYWDLYFELLETIRREFDKNGISIPYNQLDVHIAGSEK